MKTNPSAAYFRGQGGWHRLLNSDMFSLARRRSHRLHHQMSAGDPELMEPPVFKLYGERNTGTNYIEELVALNLHARVIEGFVPRRYLPLYLAKKVRTAFPTIGGRLNEAGLDRYFTTRFDETLGWKHMCPDADAIGEEKRQNVRFACLVKNPYAWFASLHRMPHHRGSVPGPIEEFANQLYPVKRAREGIDVDGLLPMELWNVKTRAYLDFVEQVTFGTVARYEDFLGDEKAELDRLGRELRLVPKTGFTPVPEPKKRVATTKAQGHFKDYHLKQKWRAALSPETLEILNDQLDHALAARLGYETITADDGTTTA